jgi:hypothetical protein
MTVCFITGQEDSFDYPSDLPEAYWRVLLPSYALGTAAVLGREGHTERALRADVVWIYEPLCFAALKFAEDAKKMGRKVVVDWSEDIYARPEQDRPYQPPRIEAAEKTMAIADMIVVANPTLAPSYPGVVRVVESVIPLKGWDRMRTQVDLGWWSDGRQKLGFEKVAPALQEVMDRRPINLVNVQFAHERPLVAGLDKDRARQRASRLSAHFGGTRNLTAEQNLHHFRDVFSSAVVSLECYLPGSYRDSVSDVPLLRAAALGIPSLTTRHDPPRGSVEAPPDQWADILINLIDSGDWVKLGREARAWAETRSTYTAYEATIQEVQDAYS